MHRQIEQQIERVHLDVVLRRRQHLQQNAHDQIRGYFLILDGGDWLKEVIFLIVLEAMGDRVGG